MPALGMAQDTGKLVKWHKAPGDAVESSDILFEVETDKSVMEVEAGHDGFLAACLALEGEEVPVGQPAAVISAEKPENPMQKSVAEGVQPQDGRADVRDENQPAKPVPKPELTASKQTKQNAVPVVPTQVRQARPPTSNGRILASPKAKWLAHEKGLDLAQLLEAGAPQPYHACDIEALAALPVAPAGGSGTETLHIQAKIPASGLADFITWMQQDGGIEFKRERIWASFAAGALRAIVKTFDGPIVIEVNGIDRNPIRQTDPDRTRLSQPVEDDESYPQTLIIRDLGETDITSLQLSAPEVPVISVCENEDSIILCLDFNADQLDEEDALRFIGEFAARLRDPLRQLL